jgi:hypothetical protein
MMRDLVESALFYRDGNKTLFEPEAFPWVAGIDAEWKAIRKELDVLTLCREEIPNFQDVSKAQKALTEGDQWKIFWFYSFGNKKRVLRAMPGDGATFALHSGYEECDVLDSCAPRVHRSAPRTL